MPTSHPAPTRPNGTISATSATALVVANMVGVGVFTTSGYALQDLGDRRLVLVAWLVGGLLALCGALSYGALALRIPASGGEYEYLRSTLHPAAGVAAGIVSLLAGFAAPLAAAAHLLQVYGCRLVGLAAPESPWVGTVAVVVAALAHGHRVPTGTRLQDLVVALKLLLIGGFVVAAAAAGGGSAGTGTVPVGSPAAGFVATMPWIYLAYSGWNASAYVAGEVADAQRAVPRAMLVGCALVTVLYLALNAAFLWSTDASALAGKPEIAAVAAHALLGRPGEVVVTATVTLALLTSVLGQTMAGPRVLARMADDGVLPRALATVAGAPPRAAIGAQAGLALVFLWAAGLQDLMTYIGWTLSLCAAAAVLGLVRLRWREGAAAVRCPGWPWVPFVFVGGVLGFAVGAVVADPMGSLLGLGTIVLAALVAHGQRVRRR